MKKKIIILVLVLLIFLGSFLIYNYRDKNKENDNKNSTKVNEIVSVVDLFEKMDIDEYVLDDFIINSVNVSLNDGNDSVEVVLTSKKDVSNLLLELYLYDKDEKVVEKIDFSIDSLFASEERTLFCYVNIELNDVVSFEVKEKND